MYTVVTHRDEEVIIHSRKGIDAHVGDQLQIGDKFFYVHARLIQTDLRDGNHTLFLRVNTEPPK